MRIGVVFLIMFSVLFVESAEDLHAMEGLDAWMARSDSQKERSYPFVRCAGLYAGIIEYAGVNSLGEKTTGLYQKAIVKLSVTTALIRAKENGGSPEQYTDQVIEDRQNAAALYIQRMKSSYAETGQAFGDDNLIKNDIYFCRDLTNALNEKK